MNLITVTNLKIQKIYIKKQMNALKYVECNT